MSAAQQVNLRINADLLARIDANAQALAMTRTEYLLSWLPDTHEHTQSSTESTAAKER